MVSNYPPYPAPLPSNPLLLLTPATQSTQILAFRAPQLGKQLAVLLLGWRGVGWKLFDEICFIKIDILNNRKRGWVLALRFKALCCFKVLFGSQYRVLAPL